MLEKTAVKDIDSGEGRLTLKDGAEFIGYFEYNDKLGLINLKTDSVQEVFTTGKVRAFIFYSALYDKQRTFYSLNCRNKDTGKEFTEFFEILEESETFALVSLRTQLQIVEARGNPRNDPVFSPLYYSAGTTSTRTQAAQHEFVGFVNSESDFDIYMVFTTLAIDGLITGRSRSRARVLKGNVFENYLQSHWPEIKKFVKAEKLDLKEREDLVKIVAYYKTLAEQ